MDGEKFDWRPEDWEKAGRRVLELATSVSTHWEERRPAPTVSPAEVRERFRESLPKVGVPFDEVASRLEAAAELSTYIGHPPLACLHHLEPRTGGGAHRPGCIRGELEPRAVAWWSGGNGNRAPVNRLVEGAARLPAGSRGCLLERRTVRKRLGACRMRDQMAGWDVRTAGTRLGPPLRIYASEELHYCHQQATELLGLGREGLRLVPTDDDYRMRPDVLEELIAADRRAGYSPIGVVATAGTVGTGAIDPIPELRALTRAEGLWLHVDGAYGAFAAITPSAPPELAELAEADSIACDPHKWLYAPIDAGVTLVREPGCLERSFSFHASYLHHNRQEDARIDLAELSPENSRRARGLKIWASLLAYGADGYRDMIERNLEVAAHLERQVIETENLVLAAPRGLSIVCWRVEPPGLDNEALDALQHRLIEELERRGIAMVSNARLKDGRSAIRACVVNFRTSAEDVEAVVAASAELGKKLTSRP